MTQAQRTIFTPCAARTLPRVDGRAGTGEGSTRYERIVSRSRRLVRLGERPATSAVETRA